MSVRSIPLARRILLGTALLCGGIPGQNTYAGEWSGRVGAELRLFTAAPLDPRQAGNNLSLFAEPEYYARWNDGRDSLTFVPFLRWDQHDDERTHADIRELTWQHAARDWELSAGIRKIFWGVTESQHLVDIINQTDLVENPDGEEKLGQPMINLALIRDWGTLDFFLLPGFRERIFPGVEGRLRTQLPVDTSQTVYASSAKRHHLDAALRWRRTLGDWDLGLSHFSGTSREPRLSPGLNDRGEAVLIPRYDLIDQTGLDVQLTRAAWLWKLEAIRRVGQGPAYYAATGGFEYTLSGPFDTATDLGLVAEYLYDERGGASPNPFQDDLMLGLRFTFNDVQSSDLLIAAIVDRQSRASSLSLEANRRIGASWKLAIEARGFAHSGDDLLSHFRNDDYLQVELSFYY